MSMTDGVADAAQRWRLLGLFDGVAEADRDERTRLLSRLESLGVPEERMVEAALAGRLEVVWLDELFGASDPRRTVTPEEIGRRLGAPPEMVPVFYAAVGLPISDENPRLATEEEAEAVVSLFSAGMRLLPPEGLLELARVYGQAMRRIADAEVHVFRVQLFERLVAAGVPRSAQAGALQPVLAAVTETLHTFLGGLHDRHLEQLVRHEAVVEAEREHADGLPGSEQIVVLFADLAGFTARVETEGDRAVISILDRFASIAEPLAAELRGTVVKTIGDAYMLTWPGTPEGAAGAVRFGCRLIAACADDPELPDARIGAALGAALPREGDWYGQTVNLASRLTARARSHSMLVTEPVRDAAQVVLPASRFSRVRVLALRGIERPPRVYRLRELGEGVGGGAARVGGQ